MGFSKNANVLACAFKFIEHHISALFSASSLWKLGLLDEDGGKL